jgi:hypothetical protein
MDVCKADKSVIQSLLEMPFSRESTGSSRFTPGLCS